MKKFLLIAAAGIVLGCAVAGARGMQVKDLKSLARMVNRTNYAVSSNGSRVEAKSSLPRTVKLLNTKEVDNYVPQSVDEESKVDTTNTVLCHLEYDSFGRLSRCVREASDIRFYDVTFTGLRDTLLFNYHEDGRLSELEVRGYDIDFFDKYVQRTKNHVKFIYDGDRLVGEEETYDSEDGYSSFSKNTVAAGKLLDRCQALMLRSTMKTDSRERTKCRAFVLDETNADGSPKRVSLMDSVGVDTYETLIGFEDIKWNKFTSIDDMLKLDLTALYMGFNDSQTGAPLSVFTDCLNTDKNDVASFKVVFYDEGGDNDTVPVVVSHVGKELQYDLLNGNGDVEERYNYEPHDDDGGFCYRTNFGGDMVYTDVYTFSDVSQLPDCLYEISSIGLIEFEDFELFQQNGHLLTLRNVVNISRDNQGNITKFETEYRDDGLIFTQIAECSDFMGYTSVAEIDEGASWTAVGGAGKIDVRGAGGKALTVYGVSGRLVYASASADNATVTAQPGIYVVKVGNKCKKVAVR